MVPGLTYRKPIGLLRLCHKISDVLSLDLLRSFLAVHRAGSITAAAEALGLSQPTVTAHLRSLEQTLDRPLFDRVARGVVPTAAAHELARRVAGPIDALQALARDEVGELLGETVHLGGASDFICHQALPALSGLVAGGLQLRVRFGLPEELVEELVGRRLDLVLSSIRPRRSGLAVTPLYDETFALVAAPSYDVVPETAYGPEVLRGVPLVAYAEEAPILRRYWRTVFGVRLSRPVDLVVPDLRGVLEAVLAGAGASVLPTYLCEPQLAAGRLRLLVEPELPPLNTIYVVTRADAGPRSPVGQVRQELLRAFG